MSVSLVVTLGLVLSLVPVPILISMPWTIRADINTARFRRRIRIYVSVHMERHVFSMVG